MLRLLDRDRAHQHRPSGSVQVLDLVDNRAELLALRTVDHVRVLDADQRAVRRDHEHFELVDLVELGRLGLGRTGHARELLVHPEVVLEGDGREGLVLALDLHLLLGLDRLVQAVGPAPPRHQAAGELVDDDDFAVLDHVVHVALEERVCAQGLVDVVQDVHVGRVPQVLHAQELLDMRHAHLGQRGCLGLLVDDVVSGLLQLDALLGLLVAGDARARLELGDDGVDAVVLVRRLLGRAADDQRRARFVDQDRVHLVDDGVVVPALDIAGQLELHVVAQVVEAQLVVRAVGNVSGVGLLALFVAQVVLDHADCQAQEAEDAAHPLAVALGQVVVDRDDVHAFAPEGVQVGRQRGHERLALAGLHLRDHAAVQHDAADELHVEVAHVEHAPACLAHDGKGLGQQLVQRLPGGDALPQLDGLESQLLIGEPEQRGLDSVDLLNQGRDALQLALVLCADDLGENRVQQEGRLRGDTNGGRGTARRAPTDLIYVKENSSRSGAGSNKGL